MKKFIYLLLVSLFMFSCGSSKLDTSKNTSAVKENVTNLLNNWHKAAAEANYDAYFDLMAPQSIFIGTDATENWTKPEFMAWAKPFFDKGRAWNFSTLERNIFVAENSKLAWFDELLDTPMGLARGSGVVTKEDGEWKVKHYVLSLTFPNEKLSEVMKLKSSENAIISELKKK